MMKGSPTYRQREVLQFLRSGGVPLLKLIAVGEVACQPCAGWLDRAESREVKTCGPDVLRFFGIGENSKNLGQ